jgi:hypothetical protein
MKIYPTDAQFGSEERQVSWGRLVTLLIIALGIFGVSYVLNPAARKTQQRMEQELKSLPLPPNTKEQEFNSGYQPTKGRASRTFVSTQSVKGTCAFFSPMMSVKGWQKVQEACYPAEAGHTLLSFRKGEVTCQIQYLGEDISGMMKYVVVSTWPR